MKTIGIICECNLFHAGHKRLMDAAKASGEDVCLVALMSGNFVQRGEPAVLDATSRSFLVREGGADLVLELPFPYSSGSALDFATAGVRIFQSLHIDELWFGSESGSILFLSALAETADSEAFQADYRQLCLNGTGTAAAFRQTLQKYNREALSVGSNDLLGIAYLQAMKRENASVRPVTLRREGMDYRQTKIDGSSDVIPSASCLRELWRTDGLSALVPFLSEDGMKRLTDAEQNRLAPVFPDTFLNLAWHYFRMQSEIGTETAESEGGLLNRLHKAAWNSDSAQTFLDAASSGNYPTARLFRGMLFAMTQTFSSDLQAPPAYSEILNFNEKGKAFLAKQRRESGIPLITKPSEIPQTVPAKRQSELGKRADSLYTLCMPQPRNAGFFRKQFRVWEPRTKND